MTSTSFIQFFILHFTSLLFCTYFWVSQVNKRKHFDQVLHVISTHMPSLSTSHQSENVEEKDSRI